MTLVIRGSATARLSILRNDVDAGDSSLSKHGTVSGGSQEKKGRRPPLHRFYKQLHRFKTEALVPRIFHLIHAFVALRFAHPSLITRRCAAERCLKGMVCKTIIRRFESDARLQLTLLHCRASFFQVCI